MHNQRNRNDKNFYISLFCDLICNMMNKVLLGKRYTSSSIFNNKRKDRTAKWNWKH